MGCSDSEAAQLRSGSLNYLALVTPSYTVLQPGLYLAVLSAGLAMPGRLSSQQHCAASLASQLNTTKQTNSRSGEPRTGNPDGL